MSARRPFFIAGAVAALVLAGGDIAAPRAAEAPPVAGSAKATYYRAENVAKSFAEGAVLFAGDTNYMIHTSRREKPGRAEVHTRDTDLIHVLEGSAVFVTGGRALDLENTGADEWRGSGIEGGETRVLGKGDVIIVPAGTPHWFKEVRGPVLYYTVKVR
jgi:mannose-6-phosphate isomerase-like protein (cupin superfamily)